MLVSILNIFTEYELEEDTPIIEDQLRQNNDSADQDNNNNNNKTENTKSILDNEHRRKALRNKILAIAKVSRMYSVLREEREKVQYLKSMNQGILPRGALAHGTDSLNETLSTFERARKEDLINEKLPPSLDQVEMAKKKRYEEILRKANEKK